MNIRTSRRAARLVAALALTAGLAACADDRADDQADNRVDNNGGHVSAVQTAPDGSEFNDADVSFATDMVPHHAQAVEMVALTDGRTLDPDLEALATQIRDAQVPEVESMVEWLTAWREPVPETSLDHADAGHDMPEDAMDSGMPGMMSEQDMRALADASDADFPDMWLRLMREHHQGAIEMARTEKSEGLNPDALELADSIITTQRAEIDQIDHLLGG